MCLWCRAAALGHFDVLQTLSAYGADFKARTSLTLENAVHFALTTGNQNVIRFLGLRGIVRTNTYVHTCVHKYVRTYTRVLVKFTVNCDPPVPAYCAGTGPCMYVWCIECTYVHMCTHIHTYIRTYVHTYVIPYCIHLQM